MGRPAIDLTGLRTEMLTALYQTENRTKAGCAMWMCKCKCGNQVELSAAVLTRKKPQISCGCHQGGGLDLIGKKFGRLTAIKKVEERSDNQNVKWECVCDCGKKTTVIGSRLNTGKTISCGCYQKEK